MSTWQTDFPPSIDSSSRRGRVKKICVITKAIFVHLSDHYRHLFIIYHFKISCEDCIARLTLGGDGAGSKKWFHDGGREAAAAASLTHWPFIWCHHLTNQKYAKPWICVHYTPIQGFAYCAQCAYSVQTFRIYCFCYSDPHEIPNHLTFPLDLCT